MAETRPNSRVNSVTIRLVSLNSMVLSTIAVDCSAAKWKTRLKFLKSSPAYTVVNNMGDQPR
jgi:hypothetical protein